MDNKEESEQPLHIALLPWLAFGHLLPFHHLAVALAKAGHHISFISTPRDIQRLPKVPDHLLSLITFVSLPLPHVEGLPEQAESTNDMASYEQSHLLKVAYDLLQEPIKHFLIQSSPDWIVHDFAAYWCSAISSACGVRTAMFTTFPASVMSFWGPHEVWAVEARNQCWPEPKSLTAKPEWIPFPSKVAFSSHEAQAIYSIFFGSNVSGITDFDRVKLSSECCDVMAIRSCDEYEGEYLELIGKFNRKPVIPVGLLPPVVMKSERDAVDDSWSRTFSWLDEQEPKSVVFVSFGSEYKFSRDEVQELAHGLEQSNVPFLWALRRPTWLAGNIDEALPEGLVDRIKGRGIIEVGWAPQMEILAHPTIGGSLFHCGMGSIVETLGFGHVLILMPMIFDQGLNARFLAEKGVGIEVERNGDGSFSSDEIARALRTAMVSDEGEALRAKAREVGTMVGDQVLHGNYVKRFAKYLRNARIQSEA